MRCSWATSVFTCTGLNRPTRIICAIPRASLRSVLLIAYLACPASHQLFLIGGELPDGAHRHSRVDVDAQDPRDALPRRLRLVTVDPDRRYCAMVKRSRLYVEF